MRTISFCTLLLLLSRGLALAGPAQASDKVTILYDAFGNTDHLKKDWGFAALIEHGGRKILFDTGNNPEILAANVRALGIDLRKLDFVVISHRHGDHTSGLSYVLRVNHKVKIFVPAETFGSFGSTLPKGFYRSVDSLPANMRYFQGAAMEFSSGSPWPNANFVRVDTRTEVAPGISLIPTVSKVPGTLELRELTLAIETPQGLMMVVGCSHPGIEEILTAASSIDPHLHLLIGGLHLVKTPDSDIERLADALHNKWKVDLIAPGHCTGEPAFAKLKQVFGDSYLYAGLGSIVGARQ